jgi:hypothetical protein
MCRGMAVVHVVASSGNQPTRSSCLRFHGKVSIPPPRGLSQLFVAEPWRLRFVTVVVLLAVRASDRCSELAFRLSAATAPSPPPDCDYGPFERSLGRGGRKKEECAAHCGC